MKSLGFLLKFVILFSILLSVSSLAQAQATRTWVASPPTGDDANPCSRTAPCATFAGAISKTHEGGEIDVIEPGGYGTVSINKAITIDGGTGAGWASILATQNTDAISINVTSGDHADTADVLLRNLTLIGAKQAGTGGDHGIDIIKAFQVHVQNVNIQNFSNEGINVHAADVVSLWVQDAMFTRDSTAIRTTTTSGLVVLQANRLTVQGNTNGLNAVANTNATIRDSYFSGQLGATNGAVKASSGCTVSIENTMFAVNVLAVNSDAGGTVRISNNSFYNNTTALTGAGTIATATNTNKFAGNGSDGTTNAVITLQ
jgi:hypothetical protein